MHPDAEEQHSHRLTPPAGRHHDQSRQKRRDDSPEEGNEGREPREK
jgi:hypothetical protein